MLKLWSILWDPDYNFIFIIPLVYMNYPSNNGFMLIIYHVYINLNSLLFHLFHSQLDRLQIDLLSFILNLSE